MQSMIRLMARELYAVITPEMKRLKPSYTADSWVGDIISAIRSVSRRFASELFERQIERVANTTISRAEAKNAQEFQASVNAAVGVNMNAIFKPRVISDYMEAAVAENVALIKSIPSQYFEKIEAMVLGGMKSGLAPTAIAKQIQEETGSTYERAKFIARDQMAKVNSDLTRKRQMDSGIEFYKSQDANDERVSGNPAGRYPKAKISCWGIARRDIGFGKGVYTVKAGASWAGQDNLHPGKHHPGCRCVALSLFEGVNYFPEDGNKVS